MTRQSTRRFKGNCGNSRLICGLLAILLFVIVDSSVMAKVNAADSWQSQKLESSGNIVSQYKSVFTAPSKGQSNTVTDAVLMGNGDLGVAISGPPEALRFCLNKNDFWRLKHGYEQTTPKPIGGIDILIPSLSKADYRVEQDLHTAVTHGEFSTPQATVTFDAWVCATENVFVVKLQADKKAVDVEINDWIQTGNGETSQGMQNGIHWKVRKFTQDVDIPTATGVALKIINAIKPQTLTFRLNPGSGVLLAVGAESLFKNREYLEAAIGLVEDMDNKRIDKLLAGHRAWWADYWARSFVRIPDKKLEKQYYTSLYIMGSCSRDPEFPPPIFGTWTLSDSPAWAGDYHMNYNHVAPFYGLYSSNRLEQADPQDAPLLDFMPRARTYSKKLYNTKGVVFPVGIGPKGIDSTIGSKHYSTTPHSEQGVLLFGQKSNAAYATVNMIQRWYLTLDKEYARKVYQFIREVADFWQDYLKYEKGPDGNMRYVIYNDAVHEGTHGDFNPVLSLGLVRLVLGAVYDMSLALECDLDRRQQWCHILENISDFPLLKRPDGDTIFRYTERGREYFSSNTLGIQHIYPGGAIHLDSDPELIDVALNMLTYMNRWIDMNGSNSFFPAAVRVGYEPETILQHLNTWAGRFHPNGLLMKGNPHGIENCSTIPNTINMMLCMSWRGVLRPFRVWPKDIDAEFTDIRCYGAFLASGEIKNGQVQYVRVLSEKGSLCVVENPWPQMDVQLTRGNKPAETLTGKRFEFATMPGEVIILENVPQ